ncbi:hypothetical protein SSZBM1_65 [Synechococcus phage S-SZBM1]|uniref:Uncharacterized protein n=1 Tax=Synechococcus phage S-SZBM1 TaxID=2926475 RepID=A0AC61TSH0_9CAUD|nr:tail protein [Synechococcus phage S-SZBM1]UNH61182.1 hypothetical protein SSZBM1_65 [Synechococcus phage S-SZBM1]
MSASKDYKLTDLTVYVRGKKYDIRNLVAEFSWYESIDSAFIRCDISLLDSIQFDDELRGDEYISISFETFASIKPKSSSGRGQKTPITYMLQLYKIGNVIKRERAKIYTLHCGSPELYNNEANRAFGAFGPNAKKPKIVESMIVDYLRAPNKMKHKGAIEPYSNYNLVSPNWRPVDVIGYLSDKVVRKDGSKNRAGKKTQQSGFLFYENRLGYNFHSMDFLCEQDHIAEYTYSQANVNDNDQSVNAFRIETIRYPDRLNHLEKMRSGTYKTCTYGIVMNATTESYVPQPALTSSELFDDYTAAGNSYLPPTNESRVKSLGIDQFSSALDQQRTSSKSFFGPGGTESFVYEPKTKINNYGKSDRQIELAEKHGKTAGTVSGPIVTELLELFKIASTLEKHPPFDTEKIKEYQEYWPTRTKFKILPKYKDQSANAPNGGADDMPDNVLLASSYSAARYSLLNTLTLSITVPGNTALYAGCVVKVTLPESQQKGKRVPNDLLYSGRYLVKGLKHVYTKEGITTELHLTRDSVPKLDTKR